MAEDIKPRQLVKQIQGSTFTYSNTPGLSSATNGWDMIQELPAGIAYFVYRTYIDLSGYSAEELTTFVKGVDVQKQALPLMQAGGGAQGLNEHDIITTRALTDAEVQLFVDGPGFLPSTVDLQEVIYGEVTQLAINTTVPGTFIKTNFDTWGSGNPCATDKLHWTRIYYLHIPVNGDDILIHPSNLVIQAVTAKEKELVWIERLRRSYVLQDQGDI